MSKRNFRKHSNAFKKQVVLAALRQDKTMAEICQEFGLYESQVYKWRSQALAYLEEAFIKGKAKKAEQTHTKEIAQLHQKIGQLTVEHDFLENAWSIYQGKRK